MNHSPNDPIRHWDRLHLWHPFTPHETWLDPAFEPIVITEGQGAVLVDDGGKKYLDGNSSIWTNLHGHRQPRIDQAIRDQLDCIAHSSFLGLTNALAPRLGKELIEFANHPDHAERLVRCFFSDDGSTAIEAATKILWQYLQQNDQPNRTRFISLGGAYHGDTVGAMSLGQSGAFHGAYRSLLFPTQEVMSPACYRCPFNKAKPQQADARTYRQCSWECVGELARNVEQEKDRLAGMVMEPRVQGAAGMLMHPHGYLEKAAALVHEAGGYLILDEVMTGFGRTGKPMAFHHESLAPDLIALAKGMTGGYLPMAATLCTQPLFDGFSGGLERTFFHGHSYTGNQLGAAASLANLELLRERDTWASMARLSKQMAELSGKFWAHSQVGDVRHEGLILAVELVEEFATRKPYPAEKRIAWQVCEKAREYGLLTRGIGNVLVLMPPYCTTEEQLGRMVEALYRALCVVVPSSSGRL